jgi:DNA-binding CsgD family transcriptional regulator
MLRHVARAVRERPVLLLLTARPDERGTDPEGLSNLAREIDLRRVLLRPLDLDGATRMLESLAGERLPHAIVQTIHRESGGNPFYLRHVLEHLVEEGRLQRKQGRWSIDLGLDELGIPPGVRPLLMRRIGRLSEGAVETLRLASIYPDRFDLERLRLLTDGPNPRLFDQLDEALRARVIVSREDGYTFGHALTRRALHDAMNPERRAELHRRVAEQLRSGHDPGEVARHYHASRRIPGADAGVAFALRAAERALAAQRHEHRAVFLRIATDLQAEGVDLSSLRDLALAQAAALDIEAAESSARRVLERVGIAMASGGGPPWLLDFLAALARGLRDAGAAPAIWLPFVDIGLIACGDRRDLTWARLSVLRPRWHCQWVGLVFKAIHVPTDPVALDILQRMGDEDDIAETLDPFEPRTEAQTEAVRGMASRWRSAAAIIHARVIAASDSAYRHNHMPIAAERWRELARDSERLGSLQGRAHGYLHLAAIEADLGRMEASDEALREVGPLVAKLGPSHRHHVAYDLAVATLVPSLHRGSWEAMRQTASRTIERLVGNQTPIGLLLLGYSAMAEAFSPEPSRYEERIEALLCSLEGSDRGAFLAREALNYGVIALHEREDVTRVHRFEKLVQETLAEGIGGGRFGESLDAALGMLAAVEGHAAKAREHFAKARASLDRGSLLSFRAVVDLQDARVLGAMGDVEGWRVQLAEARRRFDALGMALWSERAAKLQAAGPVAKSVNPHARGPDGLSPREMEILGRLAAGGSAKEIACDLSLSVATVQRHVANIYTKIGVNSRVAATAYAFKHRIAQP